MPIISKIELIEQPCQHVLSKRTIIPFRTFPQTAAVAYKAIMEYAAQNGILLAGSPFVCYHNMDLERLDVEMGFPVARQVSGNEDIHGYTIPIRKAVSGIFLGPYQETDPLMFVIMDWIGDNGYEQLGEIYHYYLNDEDRAMSELLTQIVIPVK